MTQRGWEAKQTRREYISMCRVLPASPEWLQTHQNHQNNSKTPYSPGGSAKSRTEEPVMLRNVMDVSVACTPANSFELTQ